jgi:hypothetical protein
MNPVETLIKSLLPLAQLYAPLLGVQAHDPLERSFTVPEKDVRAIMKGMSESDVQEGLTIVRDKIGDGLSDLLLLIASRGKVQPD